MSRLHLQFTMLLLGSSAVGLGILQLLLGEVSAAMAYAIAVVAGYAAGTWYARAQAGSSSPPTSKRLE